MNDEWKNKRYRYVITLRSGKILHTDYFDSYGDLESWIKTGFAGIYTPDGFVEVPPAEIQSIQPVDEGQLSGTPQPEAHLPQSAAEPIEFSPEEGMATNTDVPFPGQVVTVPRDAELAGQVPQPPADMATMPAEQMPVPVPPASAVVEPQQDNEGTLTIPRDNDVPPPPPPAA